MSQLQMLKMELNSVPKELNHEFLKATLDAYYEYATNNHLPEAGWITHDVLDDHVLEIASLLDTGEKDRDFHWKEMNTLPLDDQSSYFYQLRDELFDPAFDDVIQILKKLQLSHCLMQGTKSGLFHNITEVW